MKGDVHHLSEWMNLTAIQYWYFYSWMDINDVVMKS